MYTVRPTSNGSNCLMNSLANHYYHMKQYVEWQSLPEADNIHTFNNLSEILIASIQRDIQTNQNKKALKTM